MLRIARIAALCVVAAVAGCRTPEPFLTDGDVNSAVVSYVGDLAAATAVAQKHCGQYDRVARFIGSSVDHAYFECDLR